MLGHALCFNVFPNKFHKANGWYLAIFHQLFYGDVILGQLYLLKQHVVYESRPCSVIITLDR